LRDVQFVAHLTGPTGPPALVLDDEPTGPPAQVPAPPQVVIVKGDGHGSFSGVSQVSLGANNPANAVAVLDADRDGLPDLLTVGDQGVVTEVRQTAPGTFGAPVNFGGPGIHPSALAVGDFNGDGRPDVATANSGSANVSVLLGKGDGTFQISTEQAFD